MPVAKPRTATDRSRARFARAARVLGGITLDAEQAAALDRVLAATGETAADWVRRMIAEQSTHHAFAPASLPRGTG